jgi:hypothetical protein
VNQLKSVLAFIIFTCLLCWLLVPSEICFSQALELYLLKEVVEVTTDWADVTWSDEVKAIASNYQVVECEDALWGVSVSGLDVWIAKEGYDTTRVVVEVEAVLVVRVNFGLIAVSVAGFELLGGAAC